MSDSCTRMHDDLHLKELYPRFAAQVESFLNKANRMGYCCGVFSGLRNFDQQNKLYAQGRTEPGKIVTNAKGGESFHNYGLAVDVVFLDNGNWSWDEKHEWRLLGELGKSFGLHWGGVWNDKPHFERNYGYTLPELKKMYLEGGLQKVWSTLDSQASIKTA